MADLVSQDIFDRLPARYQRRARDISARVAEIRMLIRRCEVDAIVTAAVRLQGQLRWQPETDHEAFGQEFKAACADLPEWAISEAANDFLAGKVENHTGQFMPTCAEFAKHARLIIRPFLTEMSVLRREAEKLLERAEDERRREIIAIERQDPKRKERVRGMIEDAVRGSARDLPLAAHKPPNDEIQARLDAMKAARPQPESKIPQTRAGRAK